MCAAVTQAQHPTPDTHLVLKNGAEVQGTFIELREGKYSLRLSDGRVMSYAATDVERMERLSSSETSAPSVPAPQIANPIDPSSCSIFISEKDIDKSLYSPIKDIKISKKLYGSTADMYGVLAEQARKVKADAVINVRTWHSPSGFSWASPHAGGLAVKWTAAGRRALPSLEGRCY
jgi:hypothetical protein